jgi:hypothetical protein
MSSRGASSGEVTGIVAVGDICCRFLSACEHTTDVRRAEQWMSVVDRFVVWSNSLLMSTTCRLHFGGILIANGRWAEAEEELTAAIRLSESSFRMTTRPPRCPDHGGGDDGFASIEHRAERCRWPGATCGSRSTVQKSCKWAECGLGSPTITLGAP